MAFTQAQRLLALPPYLFVDIDRKKRAAIAAGKDVINFGVGDPDQPTPAFVVDHLSAAAREPQNHRYPVAEGSITFRKTAAEWFKRRFDVPLDPAHEVLTLIGSKEGLGHLPLACLNPGEGALIPNPRYPVYYSATIFAGGVPIEMHLSKASGWLPDLDAIAADEARRARIMYLNYPNNPTGATADLDFYRRVVAFARRHDLIVVQDAAYSELWFEQPAPSILQVPGACDVAVELHSLSKTFNMTGWRIAFAAGNRDVLAALARVKANLDSGQFNAIQDAAGSALQHDDHVEVRAMRDLYRRRRDTLVDGLCDLGFEVTRPAATFYVWMAVPAGYSSMDFASKLLQETFVVVVPGDGFGQAGAGYVRFALTVDEPRIAQALQRLKRVAW